MELLKLNFAPRRSRPSGGETTAERISRLLDAPPTTSDSEKPQSPPQPDAVLNSSDQPAVPDAAAPVPVIDQQEQWTLPRPDDWGLAPADSPVQAHVTTDVASAEPHLSLPVITADSEASRSLPEPDAVQAAFGSAVEPHFTAPAIGADPEERVPLPQPDVVSPPAGPPVEAVEAHVTAGAASAEPHLTLAVVTADSQESGTLPQPDAPQAALGSEPYFTAPEIAADPEAPAPLPQPDAASARGLPLVEPRFSYGSVSPALLPARGLLYSSLAHAIIIALVLFLPRHVSRLEDPPKNWELTMIPKDALYLPALGGGDSGSPQQGTAAKPQPVPTLSVAAVSKSGVSYPGPQAIVSNSPQLTNHVQTILQPELPNPPELTKFVHMPNVVRLAENVPTPRTANAPDAAQTDPSIEPPAPPSEPVAPTIPQLRALAPVIIQEPKLTLPMAAPVNSPAMQTAAVPPAAPAPPQPAQARVLPGAYGSQARTLIALSVTPAPPDPAPKAPPGEAHGQFAVVTLPNLAISQVGIGSATETARPAAVGAGANPKASAHDATGAGTMAVGRSTGSAAGGTSAIAGPGSGDARSGAGNRAGGFAGGGLSIRGAANGSGPGNGSASGEGKGSGPAAGAFAGMTIQGGEGASGMTAKVGSRASTDSPTPGSYGITVVSTGASGGGLGDMGVFYDEPVFTVYINMATASDPNAPFWTLEYAALHAGDSGGGNITPPFPSEKVTPAWPGELAARYRNQLAVVFVVIDEAGKVQRVKIMQSPSLALNSALLAAIPEWQFHRASQNGKPVAVRALIGVPIWAPARPVATSEGGQ